MKLYGVDYELFIKSVGLEKNPTDLKTLIQQSG